MPEADEGASEFDVARLLNELLRRAQEAEARASRSYDQAKLAAAANVTEQALSDWMTGKHTPRNLDELGRVGAELAKRAGCAEPTGQQWDRMIKRDQRARRAARTVTSRADTIPHGTRLAAAPPVPYLPHTFVPRPHITERVVASLSVRVAAGPGASVALIGMSGAGKTLAAQAICSDERVLRRFPDGVLWLDQRRIASEHACQAEILRALGEDVPERDASSDLKTLLYRALKGVSCLIVLDNVERFAQIDAVDAVGPTAALLVTAQDRAALTDRAEVCPVGPMDHDGAREMLARYARCEPAALSADADRVAALCGGLPLALAVCGAMAASGHGWSQVADLLEHADYENLGARFRDYPHGSLLAAFEVGRADLPEEKQRLYTELAVFADCGPVPAAAAGRLWEAHGLDARRTGLTLIQLANRSLLTYHPENETFELHDLLARYLVTLAGPGLVDLHRRLADAHLDAWGGLDAGLPAIDEDDRYGLSRLAFHLEQASDARRLHGLLAVEAPADGVVPVRNRWFDVHDRTGRIAEYLADVARAMRLAIQATDTAATGRERTTGRALEMRYALIHASLSGIAASVPVPLLGVLVQRGVWPFAKAWGYAGTLPSPRLRARAFTALARVFEGDDADRRLLLRQARAAAQAIAGPDDRAWACAALVPLVPKEERAAVFEASMQAAEEYRRGDARIWILTRLAGHLPELVEPRLLAEYRQKDRLMISDMYALVEAAKKLPGLRRAVCVEWFDTRFASDDLSLATGLLPFADEVERPVLLQRIQDLQADGAEPRPSAPVEDLSGGRLAELVAAACAQRTEVRRDRDFERIAPYLSAEVLRDVVSTLVTLDTPVDRAAALVRIVQYLPAEQRIRVLEAVAEIDEPEQRTGLLAALALWLPASAVQRARSLVSGAASEQFRAAALTALAMRAPKASRAALFAEALEAAIEHERAGADRVPGLVAFAGDAAQLYTLRAFQMVLEEHGSRWGRSAGDLGYWAVRTPPGAVEHAIRFAGTVEHACTRSGMLAALVGCAPEESRAAVLKDALDAACRRHPHGDGVTCTIHDAFHRTAALVPVADRIALPDAYLDERREPPHSPVGSLEDWDEDQWLRIPLCVAAYVPDRREEILGGLLEGMRGARLSRGELASLAPLLSAHQFGAAVALADEIHEPNKQVAELLAIARAAPAPLRPQIVEQAVSVTRASSDLELVWCLRELSRCPKPLDLEDLYERALDGIAAEQKPSDYQLEQLGSRLPERLHARAYRIAANLPKAEDRVKVSRAVAGHIAGRGPSWPAWRRVLADATVAGRPQLLSALADACLAFAADAAPSDEPQLLATGLARSIGDVQRWWPGGSTAPKHDRMEGIMNFMVDMLDTVQESEREQWLSEPADAWGP
jgi:hypothetical protein